MNRKAFSLLEILVALAILIVGVASIVNVFPVGLHASKRAADFTSAAILAQKKMAKLMYLGYDNWGSIEDITNSGHVPCNSTSKHSFPDADNAYSWYLDIANTGTTNLAQATLWIYWNDRGNETNESFITYIAKRTF